MEKQWTTLQTQGKEITLIGTAHVSKVSAQQVKESLEEIQPDSICVELDEDRYQSLMHPGQSCRSLSRKKQVFCSLILF